MRTIFLFAALALSGCAMLRDACRPTEYVPTPAGGVREIPGSCPQ